MAPGEGSQRGQDLASAPRDQLASSKRPTPCPKHPKYLGYPDPTGWTWALQHLSSKGTAEPEQLPGTWGGGCCVPPPRFL